MNTSILRRAGRSRTILQHEMTTRKPNCLTRTEFSPCFRLAGVHQQSTRWAASSARSKKRSEPHHKSEQPQKRGPILPTSQHHNDGPNLFYARSLAARASPTTLYEAGTSRLFLAASYGAGFFNMGAAAMNAWLNVANLPAGSPVWAPYSFGVVSILMAMIGTRFWLTPASNILSIRVLPTKSPKPQTNAPDSEAIPVKIEIRARRVLPFLPVRCIEVEPHELTLGRRLYAPPPPPPPAFTPVTLAERKAEEERLRAVRQYEMDHLMTAPFRHAKGHMATIWYAIRRGLTGEAFAPIKVQDVYFKMDVSTAFMLHEGRALDRICNVEQEPDSQPGATLKKQ